MSRIDPTVLEQSLVALGELLAARDASAHLVVVGGGALIALNLVSRATRDVDVVALMEDGALVTAEPLPPAVLESAATVAHDFRLDPDWLNAEPTSALDVGAGLPAGFIERLARRTYGPALVVDFASRFDQIHLKLHAAIDHSGGRHYDDLKALRPTEAELHAAAAWIRTVDAPGPIDNAVAAMLGEFGVEDVGRAAE